MDNRDKILKYLIDNGNGLSCNITPILNTLDITPFQITEMLDSMTADGLIKCNRNTYYHLRSMPVNEKASSIGLAIPAMIQAAGLSHFRTTHGGTLKVFADSVKKRQLVLDLFISDGKMYPFSKTGIDYILLFEFKDGELTSEEFSKEIDTLIEDGYVELINDLYTPTEKLKSEFTGRLKRGDKRDLVLRMFFPSNQRKLLPKQAVSFLIKQDYPNGELNDIEFNEAIKQMISAGLINTSIDGKEYIATDNAEIIFMVGGFAEWKKIKDKEIKQAEIDRQRERDNIDASILVAESVIETNKNQQAFNKTNRIVAWASLATAIFAVTIAGLDYLKDEKPNDGLEQLIMKINLLQRQNDSLKNEIIQLGKRK